MATTTRAGFGLLLRRGQRKPLPSAVVDRMYDGFGRATRRAVFDLYRSIPDVGAAGTELARALAPPEPAGARAVGRARPIPGGRARRAPAPRRSRRRPVQVLDDAGHWPFVDEPDLVRRAALEFLDRRFEGAKAGHSRGLITGPTNLSAAPPLGREMVPRRRSTCETTARHRRHPGSARRAGRCRGEYRPSKADKRQAQQECDAERGDTQQSRKAFEDEYGTNGSKKNAFGKCVSQKAGDDS